MRPVDQKPRPGPLTQGIVHVLGIVGKHPEGAIAAHHSVRARKGPHEHCRHFLLTCRGLPIPPLARHLVNIINRAKGDDRWVNHSINKRLGVLARFALIAINLINREILIPKRIARGPAIPIQQSGHHLDQRGFARPRLAVTHESENEPAEFRKGIEPPIKVIGHQHLGQPQRLVFGNVITHHLGWLFELHRQSAAL